ncbi:DUF488 domain-containing protein [Thermopolyspora sp. NPDC052614]|uniref:DUF488 domain-containing protein n=1 Tax=Thermopolyspora sp. NPDC052614 TaxID=3155682 RepID=UPI0034202915
MDFRRRSGVMGIGYQGTDLDTFVHRMLTYGLHTLVDVRLTPISRKPGFSKGRLAEALSESGIEYMHLPALGNPKWNRAGFAGSAAELAKAQAAYLEQLDGDQAREAIELIVERAGRGLTGVLCFEADERRCHRQLVLAQVLDRLALAGGDADSPARVEDSEHAENVLPLGLIADVEDGVAVSGAHLFQPPFAKL